MTEIKMPSDDEMIAELRAEYPKLNELSDVQIDTVKEVALKSVRLGTELGYSYGFTDGDKVRGEAEAKQSIVTIAAATFTSILITAAVFNNISKSPWVAIGVAVVLNVLLHVVNRKISEKLFKFVKGKKEAS